MTQCIKQQILDIRSWSLGVVLITFFSHFGSLSLAQNQKIYPSELDDIYNLKSKLPSIEKQTNKENLADLMFMWREEFSPNWVPWGKDFSISAYERAITAQSDQSTWYARCQNDLKYNFPLQSEDYKGGKILTRDCSPEFLYSWGTQEKMNDLIKVAGSEKWESSFFPSISDGLSNNKTLYLALTPASTFPYGDNLIRFKVRPEVKFISYDHPIWNPNWHSKSYLNNGKECDFLDSEVKDNYIAYRYLVKSVFFTPQDVHENKPRDIHAFFEYQACSPKVFESWSTNTQENYNEIIRDYLWIQYAESWTDIPIAYRWIEQGKDLEKVRPIEGWFHARRDGEQSWDQNNFERMLRVQINNIFRNLGSIYAHKSEKIPEHYNYQKPLWFLRPEDK